MPTLILQVNFEAAGENPLSFVDCVVAAMVTIAQAAEGKIEVVAAENFYGNIAQQIGGDRVSVISILSNPDQDPHLFEAPAVIRTLAAAQVVIFNGADYDPWVEQC